MPPSSQTPAHGPEQHPRRQHDPQRGVGWLNRFFRKIVGPAQVDNTRPGGYFEDETLRHQQLAAMGLEMRTDANGHSYVVERAERPESAEPQESTEQPEPIDNPDATDQPPHPRDAAAD